MEEYLGEIRQLVMVHEGPGGRHALRKLRPDAWPVVQLGDAEAVRFLDARRPGGPPPARGRLVEVVLVIERKEGGLALRRLDPRGIARIVLDRELVDAWFEARAGEPGLRDSGHLVPALVERVDPPGLWEPIVVPAAMESRPG